MKNQLITLSIFATAVLTCGDASAAESVIEKNYIETLTYLDSTAQDGRARRSITWFDGLGRERLTAVSAGDMGFASRKDYDARGNLSHTWLPVPSGGDYMSSSQFAAAANAFYGSDETPYSRVVYEEMGLNRPSAEYGPGKFWSKTPVKKNYYRNETTGNLSCSLLTVNDKGEVQVKGVYAPGTLRVTETVSEDGMRTLIFENRSGKTVMERRIGGSLTADTRFVYDIRGDLRYAISPEGSLLLPSTGTVSSEILEKQSQRFIYDHRHRVISAAKAGCEPVEYVYDRLGNIALQSTGQQRVSSTWEIMKYDSRHRPAMRGLVTLAGKSRADLQKQYGDSLFTVRFTPSATTLELDMGYTQLSGPKVDVEDIAMVWFYDNYDFICDRESNRIKPLFTSASDKPYSCNGMLTGTCSNGTNSFRQVTAFRYDGKGNQTLSLKWDIFLNDYVHAVRTEYDFVNQPVKITETWQLVSEGDIQESHSAVTTLTYDEMGHTVRETVQVDGGTPVTLSRTEYDEIGRPVRIKGAVDVDYTYDIRSHLTSIASDPYTEIITYETDDINSPSHQFVNRTEDRWGKDFTNRFTYVYDRLGRMMRAYDGNGWMGEHYDVDLNAAVNFVYRTYQGLTVTDAVKQFDGMKPVKVSEVTDPNYMDAVGRILPGDYTMTYDRNGRLTKDESRDVTSISYNRFVDRPSRITFGNGNTINNVYSPDGTLQSRTHTFRKLITTIKVNSKGDTIVSTANRSVSEGSYYYGNFEKSNGKLRLNTSAGYYDMETGEHYQYLRNRQGSVMAVVNRRGETVQRTGLYPSGTPYILPCDYKPEGTNDMTPKTDHLHIGNHWMSQSGLNFYDNTARMHDPILCDMKSGDPKFFDYPSMNHFAFCGANPVNLIDPLGEDTFYFDERGWLTSVEKTKDEDLCIINGSKPYRFPANTITEYKERNLTTSSGKKSGLYLKVANDKNGKALFQALADNTGVEWGLTQASIGNQQLNVVSTSHEVDTQSFQDYINCDIISSGGDIRNSIHSHPSGSNTPSGSYNGKRKGDIDIFRYENKLALKEINHMIYTPPSGDKVGTYTKINPYESIYKPTFTDTVMQSLFKFARMFK